MASNPENETIVYVPLSGTRAQSIQRLQVGLAGLGAMVLLIGLASIIRDRVAESDASAVPEAASTVAAATDKTVNDPLADAGVAPELPAAKPTPTVVVTPPADLDAAAPAGD